MINAIGLVVFVSYEDCVPKQQLITTDEVKIEVIETKRVIDVHDKPAFEITCKFSIMIPKNNQCKSLKDYAGFVFPSLSFHVRRIARTEIYNITDANSSIKHISKAMSKLSIGE